MESGIPAMVEGFWCLTLACHGMVALENWLFGCLQSRVHSLGSLLGAPFGFLLVCVFLPLTHCPLFCFWSPPATCFFPLGHLLFYPSLVHGGETTDIFFFFFSNIYNPISNWGSQWELKSRVCLMDWISCAACCIIIILK